MTNENKRAAFEKWAIFQRNQCKVPREPDEAAFVKMVEPNPEVFTFASEFLAHHSLAAG